jgi:hypothetical protein
MKNKVELITIVSAVVLVLISVSAYFFFAGTIGYSEIAVEGILVVIVLFAIFILQDKVRNVSRGLPAKDERMTGINYKAGYYGFIAAIWTAVFAPAITDLIFNQELESSHVSVLVVIVSGSVFAISYVYLARKGH